jgi:hypothetical protein
MKLQEYKTTATLGGVSFTQSINTANLSNSETTWLFEYWSKAAKAPHRDITAIVLTLLWHNGILRGERGQRE